MSDASKANPFLHMGQWYWIDEYKGTHGPFKSQRSALNDLLKYLDVGLDTPPFDPGDLIVWVYIAAFAVFAVVLWHFL